MSQTSGDPALSTRQIHVQESDPPLPYCAFPSICATSKLGELLIGYDRSDHHVGVGDIQETNTILRRSTDYGYSWGPEVLFEHANSDEATGSVGAINLKRLTTGRIIASQQHYDPPSSGPTLQRRAYIRYSDDDGHTWTDPYYLVSALLPVVYGVRGIGVQGPVCELPNGDLLQPCYEAFRGFWTPANGNQDSVIVMRSTDHGATFTDLAVIANGDTDNINYNEASISVCPDGRVMCVIRCEDKDRAAFAWSSDSGATWTPPTQDVLAIEDGSTEHVSINGAPTLVSMGNAIILIHRSDQKTCYRTSWDSGTHWTSDGSGLTDRILDPGIPGLINTYQGATAVAAGQIAVIFGTEDGETRYSASRIGFTYLYDATFTDFFASYVPPVAPVIGSTGLGRRGPHGYSLEELESFDEDDVLGLLPVLF